MSDKDNFIDKLNASANIYQSIKLDELKRIGKENLEIEKKRLKEEQARTEEQRKFQDEQRRSQDELQRSQDEQRRAQEEQNKRQQQAVLHQQIKIVEDEMTLTLQKAEQLFCINYAQKDHYHLIFLAFHKNPKHPIGYINELNGNEYPSREHAMEIFNKLYKEYLNGNKPAIKAIIDDIYTNLHQRAEEFKNTIGQIFEKAGEFNKTMGKASKSAFSDSDVVNYFISLYLEAQPPKSRQELLSEELRVKMVNDPNCFVAFIKTVNKDIDQFKELVPPNIYDDASGLIKHDIGTDIISKYILMIKKDFPNLDELLEVYTNLCNDKKRNKKLNDANISELEKRIEEISPVLISDGFSYWMKKVVYLLEDIDNLIIEKAKSLDEKDTRRVEEYERKGGMTKTDYGFFENDDEEDKRVMAFCSNKRVELASKVSELTKLFKTSISFHDEQRSQLQYYLKIGTEGPLVNGVYQRILHGGDGLKDAKKACYRDGVEWNAPAIPHDRMQDLINSNDSLKLVVEKKEEASFKQITANITKMTDEQKIQDKIVIINKLCEEVLNKVLPTETSDIAIPDALNELIEEKNRNKDFITLASEGLSKAADSLSKLRVVKPPNEFVKKLAFIRQSVTACEIMVANVISIKEYSKYLTVNNNDIIQKHLSIIQKFIKSLDPESMIDVRAYNDDLINAIAFLKTYKQNADQFLIKAKSLESGTYPLLKFYKQKAEAICVLYVKLLPTTADGIISNCMDIIDQCRHTALLLCNSVEEYDKNCPIINTFCSNRQKESIVDITRLPSDLVTSLQYIKSHNKEINNSLKEIANYKSTIPLASYWVKQAEELIKTGNSAIATYDALPKNTIPNLAIASFVCGLCSMILSIFTGIPAIIMGHIALAKRKHNRGRGLAITGLILGYLSVVFVVIMLLIPSK